RLGIVPVYDKETKKTLWINTSSKTFREMQQTRFVDITKTLKEIALRNNANYLAINTEEDFVPQLIELFRKRNKQKLKK
ncbi:MAG: DUF58 domain-containing protein, partial [Raineya sp.]